MIRNIGEMNRRISIQEKRRPLDEYGDPATDAEGIPLPNEWITAFTRWANCADTSGKEFFSAAAEQMRAVTTFTIRWTGGITNDMRIVCNGEVYEIEHISRMKGVGDYMEIRTMRQAPETGATTNA